MTRRSNACDMVAKTLMILEASELSFSSCNMKVASQGIKHDHTEAHPVIVFEVLVGLPEQWDHHSGGGWVRQVRDIGHPRNREGLFHIAPHAGDGDAWL
jgi:hypothetical protein